MAGFQLEWREVPVSIRTARHVAWQQLRSTDQALWAALAEQSRGQAATADPHVRALQQARQRALAGYLHAVADSLVGVSDHGMTVMRRRMLDTGMAKRVPTLPWPNPASYGVTAQTWAAYRRSERTSQPATPPRLQAFLDAARTHQANNFAAGVIPVHKLQTPEGWIITPAEIGTALAHEATAPTRRPTSREWDRWLRFLRLAAQHGGFTVT